MGEAYRTSAVSACTRAGGVVTREDVGCRSDRIPGQTDRMPSIVEQIRELCVYTAEGGRQRGQACVQQEENLHTFLVAGEVQLRSNGRL